MASKYSNEVLANKIDNLATVVEEVKSGMDRFVPKEVIDLEILALKKDLRALELEIVTIKKSLTRRVWITSTLSAILGAVLVFLVQFFLTNV